MNADRLVTRRVRKGHRQDESSQMLATILEAHRGDNLVTALVYNEFATQRTAEAIAKEF